jgi:hypothetical protein
MMRKGKVSRPLREEEEEGAGHPYKSLETCSPTGRKDQRVIDS